MTQPLCPKGGNDRIYTPPQLARDIVDYFIPDVFQTVLEPCAGPIGQQAFVDALAKHDLGWYELDEGKDFLQVDWQTSYHYDWIITNPPWSKFRPFLQQSMRVADNVVFLCLVNAFFMKARQKDLADAGFGMKEILLVPTPPKPWPQTGFSLGAVHIQRGWEGPVELTHLYAP